MGVKKTKTKKSKSKMNLSSTFSSLSSKISKTRSSGRRRSRVTPEKLARKILILKLQRKLYRLKYGGR